MVIVHDSAAQLRESQTKPAVHEVFVTTRKDDASMELLTRQWGSLTKENRSWYGRVVLIDTDGDNQSSLRLRQRGF